MSLQMQKYYRFKLNKISNNFGAFIRKSEILIKLTQDKFSQKILFDFKKYI